MSARISHHRLGRVLLLVTLGSLGIFIGLFPKLGTAAAISPADPNSGETLPALAASSWIVPLIVEGFPEALVAVPVGSRTRKPLVVAMHGNFDRPEWACGSWRSVAGPEPFILCLRGDPRRDAPAADPRWTYKGPSPALNELRAALAALRDRYGDRLADSPVVFAGFSLGAILGVAIISQEAGFGRAVLVEGGHDAWTDDRARRFQALGGARVLFVCAQSACLGPASRAQAVLKKQGVLVRVVNAGPHGHSYDGEVAQATKVAWPWLIEGLGEGW